MAADIHPPVLTDVIANPLLHSMQSFWDKWGVGHSDMNNVLNTWIVMIVLIVLAVLVKNKLEMVPKGSQNFWEVVISTLEDIVVQTMGEKGRPVLSIDRVIGAVHSFLQSYRDLAVVSVFHQ